MEILRALDRGARILVLDEPTAVLTAQETAELAEVLRGLRDDGTSVVFITHKLHEVLEVADRVTVLRRGKTVGTVEPAAADEASLAWMMVGRDVVLRVEKEPGTPGEPLLELEDVRAVDDRGLPAVDGVSLRVCAGEIVAVAGIDGNGQSELIDAINGLPARSPPATCACVARTSPTARRAVSREAGVGHIAEDRHARGLVLDFSLAENLALNDYRQGTRFGLLRPRRMLEAAGRLLKEFDVRGGTPATPASSLSGGNQQKVVIAREVSGNPDALIAAQPTRGLDVGAIEFVHRRLLAERDAGRAILLFSLELDEVRALADRIWVIYDGRIVGELSPSASDEELGLLMTGGGSTRVASSRPIFHHRARNRSTTSGGGATIGARLSTAMRSGGIVTPIITVLFAFFVGGLVVLVTGHNPIDTYKAIFDGTGLQWLFPWTTGDDRTTAAINLQQTLIITKGAVILLGLAVGYAFRAGLFNIGGQGQHIVGSIAAVWAGPS